MAKHGVAEWVLLLALTAMWGSAFMFIKLGVATVPPATLVAGRIAIGATVLFAVMRMRGLALPPPGRRWRSGGRRPRAEGNGRWRARASGS